MISNEHSAAHKPLVDGDAQLSLSELSSACGVHPEFIVHLVEQGIIEATDTENARWLFRGHCLRRVKAVINLQRDLGINLPGVALALELMEEVEGLQAELARPQRQMH